MDAQGTDAGLQAWQEAANYRSAQRSLQGSWIGSLIFGGIALWIGATSLAINPLNGILLILGVCLLVTGLIVFFARRPWATILEALCLIAIGIWNICISVPSPDAPVNASGTGFFGVLGLMQIIWGFQGLWRYWERRHLPRQAPPPEAIQQLDEMVETITKSKPVEHDDMIEFQTKTLAGTQNWKARLMDNGAVFVEGPGNDILFCDRSAVTVTDEGKGLLSKLHRARFRLGNRKRTGTIAPEYLQRLADWNNGSMLTTRA